MSDMTSRRQALTTEIYRFSTTTTVRGITRIANEENGVGLRVLWTIAVISAAAITIYQLATVVSKYLRYQENVNMYYLDVNPDFPDITACKVNPYAHRWVDPRQPQFDEYYNFVQKMKTETITRINNSDYALNSSEHLEKIKEFLISPDGYYANLILNDYELWPNVSTMIRDIGFYSWNMINYRNDPDFSLSSVQSMAYNPDFQICYQLRIPDERTRDVRAMTAIFYTRDFPTDSIRTFDTSLRVSATPSVAVVIHQRGSYPDSTLAVNIAPGQETTISVSASTIQRLGKPYDDCESTEFLTKNDKYEPGALRYSVDACRDLCIQRYIMKECQCIDSTRTFTPVELNSGLPMCGRMNFTHGSPPTEDDVLIGIRLLDCYFAMMSMIESHSVSPECDCPLPCFEYNYQTSVSSTPWPHRSFQLAFYDEFIKGKGTFGGKFDIYSSIEKNSNLTALEKLDKLNSLHLIEQNFLRLKIVFDDRGVESFNSTAAITWDSLASNVGGSLSLWIGITVMTLFEFVELFIRMGQLAYAHFEESKELPAVVNADVNGNVETAERAREKSAPRTVTRRNGQITSL